jgi:glycosyltransferase involved in cell wall biosynthesis
MSHDQGLLRALFTYAGVKANISKLKYVDMFIAVGDFVKDTYEKHLRLNAIKIITIPNFYAPSTDDEKVKVENLPDDFVLFVGQLMSHKGVEVLIKAYQKLDVKTKLLIIGVEHPDYRYEGTENVLIIKNAPHPAVMGAMSKCRFLVVPSICAESASTVAREAMSQRKAVIASDIGGLKEAVVDGETGILVPPGDADKLAEALSYLLQRPETASRMGESGYKRFMANYTSDVIIPKIIEIYESLIKK